MNLIEQAEADLEMTLEDAEYGFGVPLFFKDSSNNYQQVNCQTTDIGFFIDMSTASAVISRTVEITARLSTLVRLGIPEVNTETFIKYFSTNGTEYKMRVIEPMYDRKIGLVKCGVEISK